MPPPRAGSPAWITAVPRTPLAGEAVAFPQDIKPVKEKCKAVINLIPLNKALVELEMLLIATTCLMAFPGGTSGLFKFLEGGQEADV